MPKAKLNEKKRLEILPSPLYREEAAAMGRFVAYMGIGAGFIIVLALIDRGRVSRFYGAYKN